jgi:hypothetical protein
VDAEFPFTANTIERFHGHINDEGSRRHRFCPSIWRIVDTMRGFPRNFKYDLSLKVFDWKMRIGSVSIEIVK